MNLLISILIMLVDVLGYVVWLRKAVERGYKLKGLSINELPFVWVYKLIIGKYE